jgi:hypothetical protein
MVDLDSFTTSFGEIGTLRFLVVIRFVETNFPEMTLSPIVTVSNSTVAWCPLTMTHASTVICSVPLGVI